MPKTCFVPVTYPHPDPPPDPPRVPLYGDAVSAFVRAFYCCYVGAEIDMDRYSQRFGNFLIAQHLAVLVGCCRMSGRWSAVSLNTLQEAYAESVDRLVGRINLVISRNRRLLAVYQVSLAMHRFLQSLSAPFGFCPIRPRLTIVKIPKPYSFRLQRFRLATSNEMRAMASSHPVVQGWIEWVSADGEPAVIPTPALAEALVACHTSSTDYPNPSVAEPPVADQPVLTP